MKILMNDSSGLPSGTFTFAILGVAITSLAIIVSFLNGIKFGDFSITFKDIDDTLVLGFLATTVGSYVYRRTKSDAANSETTEENPNDKK
jgi:hypothetical protein